MFLTPKQKLVFNLVRRRGMKQKDVAQQLRMAESSVSELLTRAEDRIRKAVTLCGLDECALAELVAAA